MRTLSKDAAPLRQTFILKNRRGLHARPCALLVKMLRPFECRVEIEANGEIASGHSVIGLMSLAAGYETKMTFTISGEDTVAALAAVQQLFDTCFDEAYE